MKTESIKILNPIDEAEIYIREIITQLGTMGANDFEIPTLNQLIQKVRSQKLSPSEAKNIAFTILDRKQSDH